MSASDRSRLDAVTMPLERHLGYIFVLFIPARIVVRSRRCSLGPVGLYGVISGDHPDRDTGIAGWGVRFLGCCHRVQQSRIMIAYYVSISRTIVRRWFPNQASARDLAGWSGGMIGKRFQCISFLRKDLNRLTRNQIPTNHLWESGSSMSGRRDGPGGLASLQPSLPGG